jgi:hypothetical protein
MFRGLFAVVALSVAAVSCTKKTPSAVVVHLLNGSVPTADVEVVYDGNVVGKSDTSGQFVLRLKEGFHPRIVLALRPKDPLSPLRPQMVSADLPQSYFPKDFDLNVQLMPIRSSTDAASTTGAGNVADGTTAAGTSAMPIVGDERAPELPLAAREKILEDELPPEVTITPKTEIPILSHQTPTPAPSSSPVLPSANAPVAVDDQSQTAEVIVTQSGAPLAGAQVFALRAQTRSPIFLGATGADGVARGTFPRTLRMEQFLVRHACCKSEMRPPAAGPRTNIALEKVSGAEFVLQSDAFGVSRAIPGTELFVGPTRLDVAGPIGFLSVPTDALKAGALALLNRGAIPDRYDVKIEKPTSGGIKPVVRFAGLRKPVLPTLGFLEFDVPSDNNRDATSLLWRRFRREFNARFLQGQPFRPLIGSELVKLAAGVRLSTENLVDRGWEFSALNPEMDFLVSFRFVATEVKVEYKLQDRSGNVLFERGEFLNSPDQPPEKLAGIVFERMLESLPFQGTITAVEGERVIVNIGSEGGRRILKGQVVEIFGSKDADASTARNRLVVTGRVESVEAHRSLVRITATLGTQKDDARTPMVGMRAVRVPSVKTVAAKLQPSAREHIK